LQTLQPQMCTVEQFSTEAEEKRVLIFEQA
jgi:hypothetical protein